MYTYLVVFNFLVAILLFLSIINVKSKRIYIIIGILLVIIAGFRDGLLFADYSGYLESIRDVDDSRMEMSFKLISKVVDALGLSSVFVFLMYAILGVSIKMKAILKWGSPVWLSLMIYVAHLYLAEECAAIRIGVATGFVLLSILELCNKRYWKWLLYTLIAIFFHNSALLSLLIPLIIKIPVKFSYTLLLLLLAYLVPALGVTLDMLLGFFDMDWLGFYSHYILTENVVSIYNFSQMLYCVLALYIVKNIESFRKMNKYSGELVIIYIFSLLVLPVFHTVPVFAYRSAHIFACVEIVLFPLAIKYFWERKQILISVFLIIYVFYWCNISAITSMTVK